MIEWLAEVNAAGHLDRAPREAVLGALTHAIDLLKPGGVLLCDHWTWEAYYQTHCPKVSYSLFDPGNTFRGVTGSAARLAAINGSYH